MARPGSAGSPAKQAITDMASQIHTILETTVIILLVFIGLILLSRFVDGFSYQRRPAVGALNPLSPRPYRAAASQRPTFRASALSARNCQWATTCVWTRRCACDPLDG